MNKNRLILKSKETLTMKKKTKLIIAFLSTTSLCVFAQNELVTPEPNDGLGKVFSRFSQMHQEIESMIADMFSEIQAPLKAGSQGNVARPMVIPKIKSDDSEVVISLAMPGLDHDKVEIQKMGTPDDAYLTITIPDASCTVEMVVTPMEVEFSSKQEVKQEKTKNESQESSTFYSYGSSVMRQSLPCTVSFDEVKAEYKDDVLTITLSKAEKKNVQRIPVIKK